MNILALEFATPRRSVAVAADGVVLASAAEQGGREVHAFALIASVLRQANLRRDQIECVTVGTGPGSYAGIRMAIAIAQGWRLAGGVKLLAVRSADAVAAQAHESGWRGRLHTIADAQRGEFFSAEYELGATQWRLVKPFELIAAGAEGGQSGAGEHFVRCDVAEQEGETVLVPDAAMIVRLAAARNDFVTGPELEPVYLRKAEFVKATPRR